MREQWAYALKGTSAFLQLQGVSREMLAQIPITIPPVPDLWVYAVQAPPPLEIQQRMAELFPEWMRAFDGTEVPLLEEGPTQVSTTQVDADGTDIKRLLGELATHGHAGLLDLECDAEVWGIQVSQTVTQALRMAAMYDLYLELRSTNPTPAPVEEIRRRFHLDPAWILLGLGAMAAASHATGEVLRVHARARSQNNKQGKGKMSTRDLAGLIREREG